MRVPRLLHLIVVFGSFGALLSPSFGHKSASRSGSLFSQRYAVCSENPRTKVWCAGLVSESRREILASLKLGPLYPNKNNSKVSEPAHDGAVAAVYFNLREATKPLRRFLDLELTEAAKKSHLGITINSLRAEAAYALSHLGDKGSAKAITDLVAEFETVGHGSLWLETLQALSVLEPRRASQYATDFLGRAKNFRMSMPGGSSKDRALDVIVANNYVKALPMLRRRTSKEGRRELTDHVFCRFMAARIKLGDTALHKRVRTDMTGSYSGTWMATCDNELILAFGDQAADADVLVRHLGRPDRGLDHGVTNGAYGRLLHMISSGFAPRKKLREAFEERAKWPHVADPTSRTFVAHYPIYNDAALAGLGDAKARARVLAAVRDEKDQSGRAWLAAYWAVRLRLDGARSATSNLMQRAGAYRDYHRSGIYDDIRLRVLDAFMAAYPNNNAWTAMVVNADLPVGERALYYLSRRKPKGACKPALEAAYNTSGKLTNAGVEFGLLALTALGAECRDGLETLAADRKAPTVARGAALEIAAALGSKKTESLAKALLLDHKGHPAAARARRLAK